MGAYYKEKFKGDKFVTDTKAFNNYAVGLMLKLPKNWGKYLLDPCVDTVNNILEKVALANKIYISDSNLSTEQLITAYNERISLLIDAIRLFGVFDLQFDSILGHIDFFYSERDRLNSILDKLSGDRIVVKPRISEVEYQAESGSIRLKLGVTHKNVEHLSQLQDNAYSAITFRINADRKKLKEIAC